MGDNGVWFLPSRPRAPGACVTRAGRKLQEEWRGVSESHGARQSSSPQHLQRAQAMQRNANISHSWEHVNFRLCCNRKIITHTRFLLTGSTKNRMFCLYEWKPPRHFVLGCTNFCTELYKAASSVNAVSMIPSAWDTHNKSLLCS